MTDLNNFTYTDNVHDVLAVYVNRLLASSLRSEYKNVEILAAHRQLTDADTPIQRFDGNGSSYNILMPEPDDVENHLFVITNSGDGGEILTCKSYDGATTLISLLNEKTALFIPDGNGTYKAVSFYEKIPAISTFINGLQLIWNSATSLSIGTGLCYAENGDQIEVTSTLTASSLSLSSSTWYHIYVYLSSGIPAMEVVTTAPAAWKGTAYSKTGATSRRYVGSVKTDGSGNVYRFLHNSISNIINYVDVNPSASPFLVLNAGTASTATSISLTSVMPSTSEFAIIRAFNSGNQAFYVGAYTASSTQFTFILGAASGGVSTIDVQTVPAPSQTIYYRFAAALGSGSGSIYFYGYVFNR